MLTADERGQLRGLGQGQVPAVVDQIVTRRAAQWVERLADDAALGLRIAECGCCYLVDKVALDELRSNR